MLVISLFLISLYMIFAKGELITRNKNKIFHIVMVLLIWTQFARYIGIFFDTDIHWSIWIFNFRIVAFNWATHLPFYVCRLSVVVLLYYVITKDKRVESFLFYWGATGIAAIFYPNGNIQNILQLTETFYIDHYFLSLTPFFLVVYQGYRPSIRNLFIITGVMFFILTVFIPINDGLDLIFASEDFDYFYVKDQSIVRVIFGEVPQIVFVMIHTFAAFCFFSIYYFMFKNTKNKIKN